jgi:hypothetical protein
MFREILILMYFFFREKLIEITGVEGLSPWGEMDW